MAARGMRSCRTALCAKSFACTDPRKNMDQTNNFLVLLVFNKCSNTYPTGIYMHACGARDAFLFILPYSKQENKQTNK